MIISRSKFYEMCTQKFTQQSDRSDLTVCHSAYEVNHHRWTWMRLAGFAELWHNGVSGKHFQWFLDEPPSVSNRMLYESGTD